MELSDMTLRPLRYSSSYVEIFIRLLQLIHVVMKLEKSPYRDAN